MEQTQDTKVQRSVKQEESELNERQIGMEVESDGEADEDDTCCRRAIFCSRTIRETIVSEPILKWLRRSPTWAEVFRLMTLCTIAFCGWAILYFLLGDTMLPGGGGFGLFALIIFSYSLGWSLTHIPYVNLPPVFGMLLAGMIVRNTGFYNIHADLGIGTTGKIRTFCLTFVMIRAGLQLTTTALRRHPIFVAILALLPCSIETLVLSVCCRYVLRYPWNWSFLTGAIIACMSPVVTINSVLALAERGYGEDKGLASLLCTASSIDGVHIVSLFSICYSSVFGNDEERTDWWSYIPGGLRDLILGLLAGSVLGLCLMFFPHRGHRYVMCYRVVGLILGSLTCTMAASKLSVSGGGYLATLVASFISITGWRILSVSFHTTALREAAHFLWQLVQPVLVGVIGADIDFQNWSLYRFGLHVASILIGLMSRSIAVILATHGTSFGWKERLFIVLSWLPKGTLQAALAPMAFERARREGEPAIIELALDVLHISVVAIIFLAPLGAFALNTSGPFLLEKVSREEHQRERELSYLRIVSLQPIRRSSRKASTIEPDV